MSLRHRLGAIVYDWPRVLRHILGDWTKIRNRNESITSDGRGVACHWTYSSSLHIATVYATASRLLLRRALHDWPVLLSDDPRLDDGRADVSFLIGHRGLERLPNLLATLRSIAGQRGVRWECIVVEQSHSPQIREALPPWVRHVHTKVAENADYNRAAAFNAAAEHARGDLLILQDNDILVPADYAAEAAARVREGWHFVDLKRFVFYVGEPETARVQNGLPIDATTPVTIVQNLKGGTVAVTREAYAAVGGLDEGFVGWGGEDLEFWERARAHGGVYEYGYLPLIHLWHAPQRGKVAGELAPAQQRYLRLQAIPPAERTQRLLDQRGVSTA